MNSPTHRNAIAADTFSNEVPFQDRFAPTSGRPQRNQPLMRRIEVASLLPDLSVTHSVHMIPRTEMFDRIAGGFAHGTLLATHEGFVAIEDLMPGDFVETSEGTQPILWIGSAMHFPDHLAGPEQSGGLIRVMADSFGMGRPARDLLLGPWAALLHNPPQPARPVQRPGLLTPVSDFIDGLNVFRVTPPSAVRIYHVALGQHAALQANGLQLESYHPGSGTIEALGDNGQQLFLSLFSHISEPRGFGPLGFPRISRDALEDETLA